MERRAALRCGALRCAALRCGTPMALHDLRKEKLDLRIIGLCWEAAAQAAAELCRRQHLGHEAPFEAGGEAGAAAAAQARLLDLVHDPVGAFGHQILGAEPVASSLGTLHGSIARGPYGHLQLFCQLQLKIANSGQSCLSNPRLRKHAVGASNDSKHRHKQEMNKAAG